jgi:hypothetical protein
MAWIGVDQDGLIGIYLHKPQRNYWDDEEETLGYWGGSSNSNLMIWAPVKREDLERVYNIESISWEDEPVYVLHDVNTCDGCDLVCEFRNDPYNTNGNCLAEK